MVKQKYYAVARGRVTGIYRKPYDSRCQTDGFRNSLSRGFEHRVDAVQFLRENAGPPNNHEIVPSISTNSGRAVSVVIDLTMDDDDDLSIDDDDDVYLTHVVDSNNDVIDLTGDDDDSPLIILHPIPSVNATAVPVPPYLQTLPNMPNSSLKARRSSIHADFAPPTRAALPHGFRATPFAQPYATDRHATHAAFAPPIHGFRATPFAFPYTTNMDKENGGAAAAKPFAQPYSTNRDKENGRATAKVDNEAAVNILDHLPREHQFFGALLLSSASDFVEAAASETRSKTLWETICKRVGLTALESHVEPSYDCVEAHFNARAVLVLEEARAGISAALAERWAEKTTYPELALDVGDMTAGLTVSLEVTVNRSTKLGWTFQKKDPSTNFREEELQLLRSGVVFECVANGYGSSNEPKDISTVFMGCLIGADTKSISISKIFEMRFFRELPQVSIGSEWTLKPVGNTFLNYMRQYVAVTDEENREVAFLDQLLGYTRRKDEAIILKDRYDGGSVPMYDLNESQERAASSFLHSEPNTITLVQGYDAFFTGRYCCTCNGRSPFYSLFTFRPPGTGKSTLLVSVMCRYLMEPPDRRGRLLVCASTNKAVSLLASRFLESFSRCTINAVIVGDEKKLVEESVTHDNPLRFMHVNLWRHAMMQDYRRILQLDPNGEGTMHLLLMLASNLLLRIEGLKETLFRSERDSLARALDDDNGFSFGAIINLVGDLLRGISALPPRALASLAKDLVESADIIFCTLSTAGGSLVGRSRDIDDLIVDEAAAATEPEIYIPFRLKPKRLLLVGDPQQLPPYVFSRRARLLGLSISLQERMMDRCEHRYTLLDVQYRMHPAISAFPSQEFYRGLILNGNNTSGADYFSRPPWLGGCPYTFLQVDGTEERPPNRIVGLRNQEEAAVVVDLVQKLVDLRGQSDENWNSSDRIRIITFYQEQVFLIKKKMAEKGLKGVLVATVDSSQGCEADVVILSFVRSNGGSAGFLRDNRRLNVAMTRARRQLVCVGNMNFMSDLINAPTLRRLCADAKSRNVAALSHDQKRIGSIVHNPQTTR
jgi:hypothetical protein